MTLTGSGIRRQLVRGLAFAGVAAAGYVFGITSDSVSAQPPVPVPQPQPQPGVPAALPPAMQPQPIPKGPAQPMPAPDRRVVAYITVNNNLMPITREEFGDFLMARGGYSKLEMLVNKKIIDSEAARRGITVTTVEIKAKLEETLRGLSVNLQDFERHLLPRYGKSLYEYVEDVIRPELLMNKMCHDRVKITDEDIQKVFENRFGERRAAQILTWNKEDNNIALKQWTEASKGDAEFNSVARTLADKNLAAAEGRVKPIGKHVENGNDASVVKTLYQLKVGEMSGIIEVKAGHMCIKCTGIIPPEPNAKLDDKMKEAIRKELYAVRLEMAIPKYFHELRTAAEPNLLMKGPPSAAEFREGVGQIVNQAGGPPQVPTPPPALPMAPRP